MYLCILVLVLEPSAVLVSVAHPYILVQATPLPGGAVNTLLLSIDLLTLLRTTGIRYRAYSRQSTSVSDSLLPMQRTT